MKSKAKLKVVPAELKLNLACGEAKLDGYMNVDFRNTAAVDRCYDLTKYPWPWHTESVDEISVSYYLAFIDGPERIRFMDECYRILKPEGKLLVKEAHWSGMDAVADPLVKWPPICEKSFMPFNKAWREASGRTHYPIKCDFDFGYGMSMPNEIAQRNDEFKQFAIKHYNNAAVDLLVTLTKRSG